MSRAGFLSPEDRAGLIALARGELGGAPAGAPGERSGVASRHTAHSRACRMRNPIERLWAITPQHVTHDKRYARCGEFADPAHRFRREKVPEKWGRFRDSVPGDFRVISPRDFRVLT
ncbi:MAG: hypothetical protein ACREH9_06810 [Pseudomonadota bacterium]